MYNARSEKQGLRDQEENTFPGPADPAEKEKPAAGKTGSSVHDGSKDLSRNIHSGRVYVRHILIAYRGARDAPEGMEREKEEAYNIALEIRETCSSNPDMFERLAKKYSDDRATAAQGGLIPPFDLSEVEKSFSTAVARLKPGEVSPVTETEFGFHIIMQEHVEEAVLQSVLIPFKGALHAGKNVTLSREEAEDRARMIYRKIRSGEASFDEMARAHSRDPWAGSGGYMNGVVTRGKSIPHKEIGKRAFSLKAGEMSDVFSSPLGFHIIKRHPVEARQACKIVVYYGTRRSKRAARRIIERAYSALQRNIPFQEVLKVYSDEKGKEKTKGFTRYIYRGTWIYPLEKKLFSMDTGEVSRPIELENAFVIIARVR